MDDRLNEQPMGAEPIPVAQFEGEYVRQMEGRLPAITLEMPEGYARGTHLKMEVEVRVRNVRYEEIARGPEKGDLVRQHVFALEEIKLLSAFDADQADPGVGGSASVGNQIGQVFELESESGCCYYDADELRVVHVGLCQLCASSVDGQSSRAADSLGPDLDLVVDF